jgi:hypothetical protein
VSKSLLTQVTLPKFVESPTLKKPTFVLEVVRTKLLPLTVPATGLVHLGA